MNSIISTALSGLNAASKQLNVSANNIANARSEGSLTDPNTAPYSAKDVQTTTLPNGSVSSEVITRTPGFIPSFSPGSPFANEDGLIGAPNVNLDEELILSKQAEFAYKANAQLISTSKDLQDDLIRAINKNV